MKKFIALLAALMLLAVPALAETQLEDSLAGFRAQLLAASEETPEEENPIEQADYRAQVARDAAQLVRIVAASVGEGGFSGVPDADTAWNALSRYAYSFAEDAQVFTDAQMSDLYADLFAQGGFHEIADRVGGSFTAVEGGYAFAMSDGDPSWEVIGNDTDTYSDEEIYYDLSLYTLVHSDYPMYFAGSAVAALVPSPLTAFGAQIAAWTPVEMPSFPMVESEVRLNDQEGNTYKAENVMDGNLDTCWAYPLAESVQPFLSFFADQPQQVRGLVFTPGYAKSAHAFSANRRVARLGVTLPDGTTFTADLPELDEADFEGTWVMPFYGVYEADSVTIEVVSTYDGERFDDVCISEAYLY